MAGESYAIPPKDRAVEGILWYIQHHQLAGGDRLPAERVLCEEIGVSRTALRAGIMRLISCGTLESRRGSGTYLCPPKPLNIFQETYNFSDAVRTAGLHPSSRLVSTGTIEALLYSACNAFDLSRASRRQSRRLTSTCPCARRFPITTIRKKACTMCCFKKAACAWSMGVNMFRFRA